MELSHKIGKTKIYKKEHEYELHIKDEVIKQTTMSLFKNDEVYVKNVGEILMVEKDKLKSLPHFLKYKKNLMEYKDICKLVYDIAYLEKKLREHSKCIIYFNFDDIIVINEKVFLFLNDEKISEIEDEQLTINFPIDKSLPFLYPEITMSKSIPIKTSYKASYYSLGLMVLSLLLPEKKDMLVFDEKIKEILYPTALYWFLIHALEFTPEKRELIMM